MGDREREGLRLLLELLWRELDRLLALGVSNVRLLAGSEGADGVLGRVAPTMRRAPGEYNMDVGAQQRTLAAARSDNLKLMRLLNVPAAAPHRELSSPCRRAAVEGLDYALAEIGSRGMNAVLCLKPS